MNIEERVDKVLGQVSSYQAAILKSRFNLARANKKLKNQKDLETVLKTASEELPAFKDAIEKVLASPELKKTAKAE